MCRLDLTLHKKFLFLLSTLLSHELSVFWGMWFSKGCVRGFPQWGLWRWLSRERAGHTNMRTCFQHPKPTPGMMSQLYSLCMGKWKQVAAYRSSGIQPCWISEFQVSARDSVSKIRVTVTQRTLPLVRSCTSKFVLTYMNIYTHTHTQAHDMHTQDQVVEGSKNKLSFLGWRALFPLVMNLYTMGKALVFSCPCSDSDTHAK